MTSQDKARKAYEFLKQKSVLKTPFTIDELIAVTDWATSTVNTYITKQWRDVVKRQPNGQIIVLPEIQRLSENAFLQLATQNRKIFTTYRRVKFREVITYEFLLPLTREDQLRKALDDLFYTDTIRQRLLEIGLVRIDLWIKRNEGEFEDNYIDRACKLISSKFGGYSISHVFGRYRAAPSTSREDAARMLAADERYIIDETTAAVRFIIPLGSTRMPEQRGFDEISFDALEADPAIAQEAAQVHWLFFNLFVEAIVRMVKGEDEIWLLEETGRTRSLYVWERA